MRGEARADMPFTKQQVEQLKNIHKQLLSQFTYKTDQDKRNTVEYWEGVGVHRPTGPSNAPFTGDCEEFAMVAVQKVNAAGFSARLVICWVETGEGHCIAEVSTEDGDESYFMDNRQRKLSMQQELKGYRFHSVSPWNPQPGDQRLWYRVDEPTA